MSVHPLQQLDIGRLQQLLDEAETERTRLNRRIRRLRNVIRAAENGDEMPDLAALARQLQRPAAVSSAAAPAPAPPTQTPAAPAFQVPPELSAAPSAPPTGALDTRFGAPVAVPAGSGAQLAAPASLPTVDVGRMRQLSDDELDTLPYGVVTLDADGRIVGYNDTESRLVGLPKDRVLGRNFFSEVAPCTRVREFEGRFRDFAAGNSPLPVETFEFVFQFAKGAQRVLIMFSPARHRGEFFVSMVRR